MKNGDGEMKRERLKKNKKREGVKKPAASSELVMSRRLPYDEVYDIGGSGGDIYEESYVVPPEENIIDKSSPEDMELDVSGSIFASYLNSDSFAGKFIEAYDYYLDNILPQQVRAFELTSYDIATQAPTQKLIFTNIEIIPPKQTPQECLLRNLTYAVTVKGRYSIVPMVQSISNPTVYILATNSGTEEKEFDIARIPVMVGSKYDIAGRTQENRIASGECPLDPGCYYIINGGKKVVTNAEKLKLNMFCISFGVQDIKSLATCQMLTSNVFGISAIVLFETKMHTIEVHIPPFGKDDKRKNIRLNVYQLFRLMARYSEIMAAYNPNDQGARALMDVDNITYLILQFVPEPWKNAVKSILIINQGIAKMIPDDVANLEEKRKGTYPLPDDILKRIDDVFMNHMASPRTQRLPMLYRLQLLAMMVARLAEVMAKLRLPDDRDDWANKRVDTSSKSLEYLFCKLWKDKISRIQVKLEKGQLRMENIFSELNGQTLTEAIFSSFTGQNWGAVGNGSREVVENMIETLKTEHTILAIYAAIRRFIIKIDKRVNSIQPRISNGSQYGTVCYIDTTEGATCGLIKHMTVMTSPTIDQDQGSVEKEIRRALLGGDGTGEFAMLPSYVNNSVLLHNGRFLGWVPGPESRQRLLTLRRGQQTISRDTSIVLALEGPKSTSALRRHIMVVNGVVPPPNKIKEYGMGTGEEIYTLHVYSNGGRLARPLLVVNPTTRNLLIADLNMWQATWNELLDYGCVEYLDTAELHYVYIAMSIDDFKTKRGEIIEIERRLSILKFQVDQLTKNKEWTDTEFEGIDTMIENRKSEIVNLETDMSMKMETFVYTHCEIDPAALLGTSASFIPFLGTNQSPRNTYQCVRLDEEIVMADGSYKMMKDIVDGDEVMTIFPKHGYNTFAEIPSAIYNKKISNPADDGRFMIRVTTIDGRKIDVTNDHRFWTSRGWVEAQQLNISSHLIAIRFDPNDDIYKTVDLITLAKLGAEKTTYVEIQSVEKIDDICLVGCFTTISENHNYVTRSGFINHNCNMGKQAVGVVATNNTMTFTTQEKISAYPTPPTIQTQMSKMLNTNTLPFGQMATLLMQSFDGQNVEDAFIVNQDSADRGWSMMTKYFTIKHTIENTAINVQNPLLASSGGKLNRGDKVEDYAGLDDEGLPKRNYIFKPGMYILGLIKKQDNSMDNESIKMKQLEYGTVDRIFSGYDESNHRIIKIKLRDVRKATEGWKFAPRMAQKGTSSIIRPDNELPKIMYGRDKGISPNMIMNIHAIPGRMTISLLFEILASTLGGLKGQHIDATAFRNVKDNRRDWETYLYNHGYDYEGNHLLMDARTGLPFSSQKSNQSELSAKMYMGPIFIQTLKHMVQDKEQKRGTGACDPDTQAPTKGRQHKGGLKFGEMEVATGISHGAAEVVHDAMVHRSDRFEIVICKKCGTMPNLEKIESIGYKCKTCQSEGRPTEFLARVQVAYIIIKVGRLFQAMCLEQRFTETEPAPLD